MMLKFSSPLLKGRLIKRYKRFFADVELSSGEIVTAHCPNTGTMKTCGQAGDTVYLLHQPSPRRKLAYTWELTATDAGYIGVNTARPNQVVASAITAGLIKELRGYDHIRPEVKYGESSRIDLLLTKDLPDQTQQLCYVEIKNATMLEGERVIFPDAVTARGLKHLRELKALVDQGHRAVMLFFINRPEGEYFMPAAAIDPVYATTLREVSEAGVEILAYRARHDLSSLSLGEAVPIRL